MPNALRIKETVFKCSASTGAVIGKGAVVAAGAVVVEGMQVPDGALVMGVPAKVKDIIETSKRNIKTWADEYVRYAQEYKKGSC